MRIRDAFLLFMLAASCQTKVKVEKITLSEVESVEEPVPPPPPFILKVSAQLIFDDSTVSSFDVLNDKSIALWNVVSGGGDATKPSHKLKVTMLGELDSVDVKIYNGSKLAQNKYIDQFAGKYEFVIQGTGCDDVTILVSEQKEVIFSETISFHCGE